MGAAAVEHFLFELRAMVEGAVAELAAQRRDKKDIKAMAQHLRTMDEAMAAGHDGTEADDNFHIAMASATHNSYITRLVEFLGRHFSDTRKLSWHGTRRELAHPQEAQGEHHALFEAISRGNAEAARRGALDHLRGAANRFGIELALDLERAPPTAAPAATRVRGKPSIKR